VDRDPLAPRHPEVLHFTCAHHGRFALLGAEIARKRADDGYRLAETRRRAIEEHIRSAGAVSVAELEQRFGVSPMTARRDLAELERRGALRRTHGGAVLATPSSQEDSFARRLDTAQTEKRALAEAAVVALSENDSLFLDSSTTSFYVARRLAETQIGVTVLTNSLPIVELLFNQGGPRLEVIGIGGTLRRLNRSFVGPSAVGTVERHFADHLFFSVKAIAANGMLTEADPLEAEVKRTMIAQAGQSILLIDRSKLSARGLTAIAPVSELSAVLGADLPSEDVAALRGHGVEVRSVPLPATTS
jgi:DeoR/GlpR family transcriptional regulator of sugar metabolism